MRLVLLLCIACSVVSVANAGACIVLKPATAPCDCVKVQCQTGQTCDATGNGICQGGNNNNPQGNAPPASLRCQKPDGSPLPTATLCEDKIDKATCEKVFGPGGAGATGQQPPPQQGQAPAQQGVAKRSPKCDLPDLAEKALQCAKTCQICCERVEHGCEDEPTYGIDCQEQKAKCKAPEWAAVMTAACGRTCGHCGAGSCRDNIHECSTYKTLCRDYTHRTFMIQNCARTCDLCGQRDNGSAQAPHPARK
ncbi:Protein PHAT-3 [Aphelenchoides avenae]|nr:Protein PHAT-3 [Aphelenchus avenae]